MKVEDGLAGCFVVSAIGFGLLVTLAMATLPLVLAGWLLGLGS